MSFLIKNNSFHSPQNAEENPPLLPFYQKNVIIYVMIPLHISLFMNANESSEYTALKGHFNNDNPLVLIQCIDSYST